MNVVVRNPYLSLILVSNVCFFFVAIFLYKLVRLKSDDVALAETTVFYLAIFPTSFFFMCGLSESTFLLVSILTFYFAEQDRWWRCCLFGVLASLTRSCGFLLVVPMLLLHLQKRQFDAKKISADVLGPLLIPSGLLIFMCVLRAYGRPPLDFIAAGHGGWQRAFAPPWWDFSRSLGALFSHSPSQVLAGDFPVKAAMAVGLVATFFGLAIALARAELSYGVYSLLLILFFLSNPSITFHLYGDLRFIVVVFPIFLLLARYGRNKWVNYAVVTFSLLFLSVFAVCNGHWRMDLVAFVRLSADSARLRDADGVPARGLRGLGEVAARCARREVVTSPVGPG